MRFYVSHEGDATIGLPGDVALVDVNVLRVPEDLRADYVALVKQELSTAFGCLWDATVAVCSEDEMAATEAAVFAQAKA